ncbi:MAG: hypothetical protein P8L32_08190, partial [Paracoccaceae bacterium]|nr:hypothetical protein [Paracoccaceae bacterium]
MCDRCAAEYFTQEEAQLVEKLPAIRPVEMTNANIFDLIGRAKPAVHDNLVIGQASPVGGATACFARMESQHLVAP